MLLKQCAKIAVIKTKILVKKMKFTIERANLLKSLSHVQSIVEKRNTIPVLSNVRIEAMEDGISFKATDMDTEITEIVDAKTIETGATTAPAHMLYDIVRKLSDGSDVELTFPDDKGQLTIASGKSKFSLSCIGTFRKRRFNTGQTVAVGCNHAQNFGFAFVLGMHINAVQIVTGFFG